MKLEDLNTQEIGVEIQIAGAIWADGERVYLIPLPGALTDAQQVLLDDLPEDPSVTDDGVAAFRVLDMDLADWQRFIRQTDLLEREVLAGAPDEAGKIPKILLRKSARQISQGVSWAVYKRDGYRCRYCGAEGVPLTVDHVVPWEQGGPSTEVNLVACCRKCNKIKANMPFDKWLRHPYYRKASKGLIMAALSANEALLAKLDSIPRMYHKPKKR
jgi:5-methylcytosine-specific restriction endonuclease McrA